MYSGWQDLANCGDESSCTISGCWISGTETFIEIARSGERKIELPLRFRP